MSDQHSVSPRKKHALKKSAMNGNALTTGLFAPDVNIKFPVFSTNNTETLNKDNGKPFQPVLTAPSTFDRKPPVTVFTPDSMITFELGLADKKEQLTMHRQLLTFYSDFFKTKFSTRWDAAQDRLIPIDEEDIDTFSILCSWLYSTTSLCNRAGISGKLLEYKMLIKVWIMADKYLMPLLQNHVINVLHEKQTWEFKCPSLEDLDFAVQHTTPDSKLRAFLIDMMCFTFEVGQSEIPALRQSTEDWNKDLLLEMMKVLVTRVSMGAKTTLKQVLDMDLCIYHEHPAGVTCRTESKDEA